MMRTQMDVQGRRTYQGAAPRDAGLAPERAASGVEELTTAECWRLVESSSVGRLAVEGVDGRPDLFPLNFLVHNGNLFVRSGPGKKLQSIAERPAVAFEVDGTDDRFHWSVVIGADARRMDTDVDIEASGILDLLSLSPTPKHDFVQLTPVTVTGRRFRKRGHATTARISVPPSFDEPGSGSRAADERALPIPHFPPLPH